MHATQCGGQGQEQGRKKALAFQNGMTLACVRTNIADALIYVCLARPNVPSMLHTSVASSPQALHAFSFRFLPAAYGLK